MALPITILDLQKWKKSSKKYLTLLTPKGPRVIYLISFEFQNIDNNPGIPSKTFASASIVIV
jgi:hypothetical protein